jgi:hypothetical protein
MMTNANLPLLTPAEIAQFRTELANNPYSLADRLFPSSILKQAGIF